jgi:protein arginine kinase activator
MKINVGFPPQFPMHNLSNLLGFLTQQVGFDKREADDKCPNCFNSYRKIGETGYVGCSECYKHFSIRLEPILRKIHGTSRHTGKVPKRLGFSVVLKREVGELKNSLKRAVENERYEEAAQIRDRIKELEEKMARGEER